MFLQNSAPTTWPPQQQLLMPQWQQLSRVPYSVNATLTPSSQRPAVQTQVVPDIMGGIDEWRRPVLVEGNFEQNANLNPTVCSSNSLINC